jgi:hypothetical protein
VGGEGVLRLEGQPPLVLRPAGALLDLPLITYHVVGGGDGRRAVFSRLRASVSGQAVIRFGGAGRPQPAAVPAAGPTGPASAGEPDQE